MSHQEAPQLAAPATEQIPTNPDQDQLFNDETFSAQAIAERQALAEDALGEALVVNDDEIIRLTKPVSEEDAQAARDALALLQAPNEELPDAVKVKRDYADNLAEHNEKQDARKAKAEAVLAARVVAYEQSAAKQAVNAADNQKITDGITLKLSREAKSAAVIEGRKADVAKRQELRDAYIAKQRLLRGEGQSKLFADEISREADKHVKSIMHPGSELRTDNVVDTQKLKDEKYGKTPASVVKNEATSQAVKDFYKGFADIDPEASKAKVTETAETTEPDTAAEAATAETEADIRIKTAAAAAEAKEAKENEPAFRVLSYRPNKEGMCDMAVAFTEKGLWTNLNEFAEQEKDNKKAMIISTKGTDDHAPGTFYVANGEVYNLEHMKNTNEDGAGWDISDMGEQTVITVGEPIMLNGEKVSGPVDRYLIEMPPEHVDNLEETWRATGVESPFKDARELIKRIEDLSEATEMEIPHIQEEGRVLILERPKQMRSWAAKQLKRLKNAPLAVGTFINNKIHNTADRYSNMDRTNKRRTLVGAVVGATALVAVAYLELSGKGTGASDQLATHRPRGGTDGGSSMIDFLPDTDTSGSESSTETVSYDEPETTSEAASTVAEKPAEETPLPAGETVSHIALDDLRAENLPTDQAHILERTQQLLDQNNITWDEARSLAEGTKIKH